MNISIIIPTFNEGETIGRTLAALHSQTGEPEIIVADGGSTDNTVELVREAGVRLVQSKRGRGAQMNAGATHASGDVLLFLHADTALPSGAHFLVCRALSNPEIAGGCFRLRFDDDRGVLKACSRLTRFSFSLLHFGDSAFFVRKEVFHQLGGYPDYQLMEDVAFWRALTRRHKHVVLPAAVVTSARRFRRDGMVKRQLSNAMLLTLFVLGVHPDKLARFYYTPLRKQRMTPAYTLRTLWHWLYSNIHLLGQTYFVLEFMKWHRLSARAVPADHPWVTGRIPGSDETVWEKNIVFRSPRKGPWREEPESDDEIVRRIGKFLSVMVKHSALPDPELPQSSKRRMPHGVNYIHGAIHYNGGWLLFDDFKDAMHHLSDPAFVREMKRFAAAERRELTIVLRERHYDPEEYAWFVAFVRAHIPWFANGNGPTRKRVLFGTPSPYAAVNPINGSWVHDLTLLYKHRHADIARPPITTRYFAGTYAGTQSEFTFLERFHAWVQHVQITAKGFQGGLVFSSRRAIEPENYRTYVETNGLWRASYSVSHPFASIERVRGRRLPAVSDEKI